MNREFTGSRVNQIDVVGLTTILTRSHGENFKIISSLWKKFNAELHKIGGRSIADEDWVKYGITYKIEENYYYMTSIPYLPHMKVPQNMVRKTLPGGSYGIFTHRGKISSLSQSINILYRELIPESGVKVKTIPEVVLHFERYDKRFSWNRPNSLIDIYIPLEE